MFCLVRARVVMQESLFRHAPQGKIRFGRAREMVLAIGEISPVSANVLRRTKNIMKLGKD